jgi:hypothetical protein
MYFGGAGVRHATAGEGGTMAHDPAAGQGMEAATDRVGGIWIVVTI